MLDLEQLSERSGGEPGMPTLLRGLESSSDEEFCWLCRVLRVYVSSVEPVGANGGIGGGRVDTSAAAIVGYRDDV